MLTDDAMSGSFPVQSSISRRQLLRRGIGAAGALSLGGVIAACGDSGSSAAGGASGGAATATAPSGTINVLGWSNYDVPGLKLDGVDAKWTPLSTTNQLFTKTAQPGTFDLALSASPTVGPMIDLDRLQPIDEARVPRLANVDPALKSDDSYFRGPDGKLYATPLGVYHSYAIWNKKRAAAVAPKTFQDVLKPELRGKIGILDDEFIVVILGNLAGFNTVKFSEQQFEQIKGMLKQLRPQVGNFYPFGGSPQLLARDEIWLTLHSSLDEIELAQEAGVDADAGYFGSYGGVDSFSLVKGAPNVDATYAYLDNSLTEEAQLSLSSAALQPVVPVQGKIPEAVSMFGPLAEQMKSAPIIGAVPTKAEGGNVGLAEWAAAFQEFKESA